MWQRRIDAARRDPKVVGGSGLCDTEQEDVGVNAAVKKQTLSINQNATKIGSSVVIEGELTGQQDLIVDGRVDGIIRLPDHVLTVGPNGRIKADVIARTVIVLGAVTGDIRAIEKVDLRESGSVDGNIVSPSVSIIEGAHFLGSVVMEQPESVGLSDAKSKAMIRK